MILFFLSILNIVRHGYFLFQTIIVNSNNTDEQIEPVKYKLSEKSLILLGLSISYVLTVLITLF
jgi:hypothetical protein